MKVLKDAIVRNFIVDMEWHHPNDLQQLLMEGIITDKLGINEYRIHSVYCNEIKVIYDWECDCYTTVVTIKDEFRNLGLTMLHVII